MGGLGAIVLAGFAALYFTGTLDSTLYKIELNYTACATKSAGIVYCGKNLTAYEQRQHREEVERRTAEQHAAEQKATKEAEQKAAEQRIERETTLRAERLCGLLREYLHATTGEQARILELMAQIAPGITKYNMFGHPTGFDIPSLKLALGGSSCAGGAE